MASSDARPRHVEPLRDRMPDYLKSFAFGIVGAAGFAAVVAILSSAGFGTAFGNTLIALGGGMLLVGGLGGGGYAHLHAIDAVMKKAFRFRSRRDDTVTRQSLEEASPDPPPVSAPPPPPVAEQKRRDEPNPRAFWRVVAGFAYLGLGALVILGLAS